MEKVNLDAKLAEFSEHWSPRIIGELNGQHIKLAKVEGEFVWHHHDDEDEFFLVLEGHLSIHLQGSVIDLDPGECIIIPRGVEHKPVAEREAHVLLFEPATTRNTGNLRCERTVDRPERI